MKKFIAIISILLFYSCEPTPRKLLIINNSNDTIFYLLKTDTNITVKDNNEIESKIEIPPQGSDRPVYVFGSNKSWDEKIYTKSTDTTLHIYIFRTNFIDKKIIEYRKYRRFDFKVRQLDSMQWVFVYK